ncbi:oxalate decarboxylase [Klebsormidium nitens]|uniref:Oxalate decarboxylase n=1 Tax=Klebsormidium nitens TaxID=105231 RepID=A0A1Y1ICN2_KLENI|nr:oxalate decarboxylase [Klebsormidium nitens]|eukprot:GAQ88714.1 oxalate decarboxylase [Klebsormidium nitens]
MALHPAFLVVLLVGALAVVSSQVTLAPGIDPKYQFFIDLANTPIAKGDNFPGLGVFRWARFRSNGSAYLDGFQQAFGDSIHMRTAPWGGISLALLTIAPGGLRQPHWHFNTAELGYVLSGTAQVGAFGPGTLPAAEFAVQQGQIFFFPQGNNHYIANSGSTNLTILNAFSTVDQIQTLQLDDLLLLSDPSVTAQILGGQSATFAQFPAYAVGSKALVPGPAGSNKIGSPLDGPIVSSDNLNASNYFYNLKGSQNFTYPGGVIQWARYRANATAANLTAQQTAFSQTLHNTNAGITAGSLLVVPGGVREPHWHTVNEFAYVTGGKGTIQTVGPTGADTYSYDAVPGNLFFFPTGYSHTIRNPPGNTDNFTLFIVWSTSDELQSVDLEESFDVISSGILGQAFGVNPQVFSSLPKLHETIAPPRNVSGPAFSNVLASSAQAPASGPAAPAAAGGNGTGTNGTAVKTATP